MACRSDRTTGVVPELPSLEHPKVDVEEAVNSALLHLARGDGVQPDRVRLRPVPVIYHLTETPDDLLLLGAAHEVLVTAVRQDEVEGAPDLWRQLRQAGRLIRLRQVAGACAHRPPAYAVVVALNHAQRAIECATFGQLTGPAIGPDRHYGVAPAVPTRASPWRDHGRAVQATREVGRLTDEVAGDQELTGVVLLPQPPDGEVDCIVLVDVPGDVGGGVLGRRRHTHSQAAGTDIMVKAPGAVLLSEVAVRLLVMSQHLLINEKVRIAWQGGGDVRDMVETWIAERRVTTHYSDDEATTVLIAWHQVFSVRCAADGGPITTAG